MVQRGNCFILQNDIQKLFSSSWGEYISNSLLQQIFSESPLYAKHSFRHLAYSIEKLRKSGKHEEVNIYAYICIYIYAIKANY